MNIPMGRRGVGHVRSAFFLTACYLLCTLLTLTLLFRSFWHVCPLVSVPGQCTMSQCPLSPVSNMFQGNKRTARIQSQSNLALQNPSLLSSLHIFQPEMTKSSQVGSISPAPASPFFVSSSEWFGPHTKGVGAGCQQWALDFDARTRAALLHPQRRTFFVHGNVQRTPHRERNWLEKGGTTEDW